MSRWNLPLPARRLGDLFGRALGGLFGSRRVVQAAPSVVRRAAAPAAWPAPVDPPSTQPAMHTTLPPQFDGSTAPADPLMPDLPLAFFGWLTGHEPRPGPLTGVERRLLRHLDAIASADAARADLLPRAPAVIPQLMHALRDASASIDALAARVERDPALVAEVVRLANGAATRGGEPVTGLPQAIERVGVHGLKRAIATVVLKPVFDAPAGSLSGRAAGRLWQHSEAKAAECQTLAAAAGLDPFDGYLAGLLHNVGWIAVLRALDRHPGGLPDGYSQGFVDALAPRRETLFGLLAMPWQLSDALTELAVERLDPPASGAGSALSAALATADRHAAYEVLGAGAMLETMA